jgi:hypothetical protein
MVLLRLEEALVQWGQFSGKYGDKGFVEVYETFLLQAIGQIGAVPETATTIPATGHLVSSCLALQSGLGYFDQWIQRLSANSARPNSDKIRRKIDEQVDKLVGKIKTLFRGFTDELLSPLTFKEMQKGKPPHTFSDELVNYLDLMSTFLRPVLPAGMFLKIVERVATGIAERFAEVIVQTEMKWSPELIWAAQQNLNNIQNWPTLIAMPSAKQQLNGISTALNKLLSSQLSAFAADAQFNQACRTLPVDAMLTILMRYQPTKTKEHFVIPATLVKSLIQKLTPFSRLTMPTKGKR